MTTPPMPQQFVRLCSCGCGQPTKVWTTTARTVGRIKGQPAAWLGGHGGTARRRTQVTPDLWEEQSNGCWYSVNKPGEQGYCELTIAGVTRKAHIFVYEHFCGAVPTGLQLDHLCRDRRCVNPDHLEPVTQTENVRRGLRAKLNLERARDIRRSGERTAILMDRYGVSKATIDNARAGRTWAEVSS